MCSSDLDKYFKVKQMTLPHYKMGVTYAKLNGLRSAIREVEVLGTSALDTRRDVWAKKIILSLNRLSSVMHILMCMELASMSKGVGRREG